jgi:hypothetical protein
MEWNELNNDFQRWKMVDLGQSEYAVLSRKMGSHPPENLPNRFRNLPEAKVLLGFLPKVQDSGIKVNDLFDNMEVITVSHVFSHCFHSINSLFRMLFY